MKNSKLLAVVMAITMIGGLTGCGNSSKAPTGDSGEKTVQTEAKAETKSEASGEQKEESSTGKKSLADMRVCAIFPGPRGDSGTVDMACAAVEKLAEEYGLSYDIVEGDGSGDASKLQASLIEVSEQDYDFILSTGMYSDYFVSTAPDYPDTIYMLFDTVLDFSTYKGDNLYCANFLQNEASYLVGALAMSMSKTGTVGFVGGMAAANISDFMWGYIEGAKYVNPTGTIAISFTNDWYDSAKAKELALSEINMGADVVFPAAGPSSEGVMEAAPQGHAYSIGVDIDREAQYKDNNPEWAAVILSSQLKCVDNAVYRAITMYADGTLKTGQEALGIAAGGVGIVKTGNYQTLVPEEVRKTIEDIESKIASGEIVVGTALTATQDEIAEMKTWAVSKEPKK